MGAAARHSGPIRLLFCAPGEDVEGGIAAVVLGLRRGLDGLPNLCYRRILYAKPARNLGVVARLTREIWQLLRFLQQLIVYRPDVIHVQSSFDKKTIVRDSIHLWVASLFRKPFLLHAHGGEWHLVSSWSKAWRAYTGCFMRRCAQVIVTSQEEVEIIHREFPVGIAACKIFNPLVLPESLPRKRATAPDRDRRIGVVFASRIIESKGILDAIEAMALVQERAVRLRVFGGGADLVRAKALVDRRNLGGVVEFRGEIPLQDLLVEYSECDIFIFPSYHLEGFPMAFFYAVACSAPIIATRVRPIPEYLREPDNCLWVEAKNPQSLAEKIEYLARRPDLRQRMSENNGELARRFRPEVVAAELWRIYERAAAGRGGPGAAGAERTSPRG